MFNRNFKHLGLTTLLASVAILTFPAAAATPAAPAPASEAAVTWGSYLTPFAADSLWNSRPLNAVLGEFEIPKSSYSAMVGGGNFSTGVFLSQASDVPMVVHAPPGKSGVWDPDAETLRHTVTIPHWPAGVIPASGSDGHADIVDTETGILHSFFQLKQKNGQWTALQYGWSRLDGRGWGDPAHYFQGARAAGVPASAGLIRKHEINDGRPVYRHALAMSLTYNALSAAPAYIYPATSADRGAEANHGKIPEGALLMLPPSFNTAHVTNPALRKVAETLKLYGGYVVDRNEGTPFVIYVENGASYDLHGGGWNNTVAGDLDRMRAALRQVVSAPKWVDGNDEALRAEGGLNALSMRGPWESEDETVQGKYDTWTQSLQFPATERRLHQFNTSSNGLSHVDWAAPKAGAAYRFAASASGGAKLRLQIRGFSGAILYDSGELGNGEHRHFTWPQGASGAVLRAASGVGEGSSVKGTLRRARP